MQCNTTHKQQNKPKPKPKHIRAQHNLTKQNIIHTTQHNISYNIPTYNTTQHDTIQHKNTHNTTQHNM